MLKYRIFKIFIAAVLMATMLVSMCSCAFLLPPKMALKIIYKDCIDDIIEEIYEFNDESGKYGFDNMSLTADIDVQLSSLLINMMNSESESGMDWSWLNDAGINVAQNIKDNKQSIVAELEFKDAPLISADMVTDTVSGDMYFTIPLLTQKYLSLDTQDDTGIVPSALADYTEIIPSRKVLKNLIYKYLNIVAKNVKTVERSKTTLTANDISQDCFVLELTMTQLEVANAVIDVVSALKQDNDVKDIIFAAVEHSNEMQAEGEDTVSPEQAYSDFIDYCNELLDSINESVEDGSVTDEIMITVKNYVNFKQDIIGIDAYVEEEYESLRVLAAKTEDGKEVGVELFVEEYRDDEFVTKNNFRLLGTVEQSKNTVSGSYEIISQDESMMFIDFENIDTELLDEGYINGSITLSPSSGLVDAVQNEMGVDGSFAGVAVSAMSLKLDIEQKNAEKIGVVAHVMSGYSDYATITADIEIAKGGDVVLPADVTSDTDAWMDSFNYSELLTRVQNSGLPDYIVQLVQTYVFLLQWM